jgi:hypothetical protein
MSWMMMKAWLVGVFLLVLGGVAVGLSACSDSKAGLGPETPAPPNLGEETSYVQGEVLVNLRQVRTSGFQTTTLLWTGTVKNLGNRVRNARMEVLTTRVQPYDGGLQPKVEETQLFGDLLPGQTQLVNVRFTFPSAPPVAISLQFAHD